MKKMLPTISIVSVNLNSDIATFRKSLLSIKMQDYPQKNVEHIIFDGGSTNGSVELARRFKCNVFIRKDLMDRAEERQYLALKKAKNDIILILEPDNILPNRQWLKQMVEPFYANKDIFCTFNAYNCVDSTMPLLTKYCALFGVSDPVLHYLQKSEKLTWYEKKYSKGTVLRRNKYFTITSFDVLSLPTLGDNGCLIKKSVFLKTKMTQKDFVHLDFFQEMLSQGYNKFGVVHNCVIHVTGASIKKMIIKRLLYRKIYSDDRIGKRKYLVYDQSQLKDVVNILKFCLFTITLIEPLTKSIRGFLSRRDPAWFLHPIICWVFLLGYFQFSLHKVFNKKI